MEESYPVYGVRFNDLNNHGYSYVIRNVHDEITQKIVEYFKMDKDFEATILDHPAKVGKNRDQYLSEVSQYRQSVGLSAP
jgi:GTP-binding protein EngB required for normal cell division